ncbi:MAG: hypothetical protein ACRDJW_22040 [Thermomicrobiales bacterium]
MKIAFMWRQPLATGLAVSLALTLVGAASANHQNGPDAGAYVVDINPISVVGNSRDAAHHFAMQANLELDVLADGTLAVRQVRGTATLQARDAVEHRVWRVENAAVSGFVILPDDGGEAVPVLEELTFTLARLHHAEASDDDRATVVVVVGPAEPPASDNGWWIAKPTITFFTDDTTLSGDGTLRYRLVDRSGH